MTSDTVAGAHLLLVEQVHNSLLDGIRTTIREHDRQRRDVLAEIRHVRSEWKKTLSMFDKIKRSRDAAVKAADDARIAFERANNDKNVTKAFVEKTRDEYSSRARKALVCKEEYIQAAKGIKEQQKRHYEEDLPTSFDKLQKIEETRLLKTKLHLSEFGLLVKSTLNEELNGFKEMLSKWDKLAPSQILQTFIDEIYSEKAFEFPEVILIDESVSVESFGIFPKSPTTALNRAESSLLLAEDPETIQRRLEGIEKERPLLEKQCDGVRVLYELYGKQPELADERTKIETAREFELITSQLESLRLEKEQLKGKLVNLLKSDAVSIRSVRTTPISPVLWDEEEAPINSPLPGAPKSCLSAIETNLDDKQAPAGGFHATVIFDFDSTDPHHELSIKCGEVVTILSNDGEWWQAQNADGDIGFVPFNYVCEI